MTKYRYLLPHGDIVDDIYAATDGEAVQELERRRPGMSGAVVNVLRVAVADYRSPPEKTPTSVAHEPKTPADREAFFSDIGRPDGNDDE